MMPPSIQGGGRLFFCEELVVEVVRVRGVVGIPVAAGDVEAGCPAVEAGFPVEEASQELALGVGEIKITN